MPDLLWLFEDECLLKFFESHLANICERWCRSHQASLLRDLDESDSGEVIRTQKLRPLVE